MLNIISYDYNFDLSCVVSFVSGWGTADAADAAADAAATAVAAADSETVLAAAIAAAIFFFSIT